MKRFSFAIIIIFVVQYSFCQDQFAINSEWIGDHLSTLSMITSDLNGDMTDDLILFDGGENVHVYLNNYGDEEWKHIKGPELGAFVWSGVAVDFNNDGKKEIVCGTLTDFIHIYTFDPITYTFELYWKSDNTFFLQNMNAVDINNDGYLDLFVCHDNGSNFIYMNDKTGSFTVEDIIDFSTNPASDMSGNYGSVWADFNGDNLIDLYLAKCHISAIEPNDGRRINQLFIQQEDGSFIEMASEFALDYNDQSWTADVGDLDNDGDADVLVTNHEAPFIIAENINNQTFEKKILSNVLLEDDFWQAAIVDVDLDGWKDIIMTGEDIYMYKNLGNFQFEPMYFLPFDSEKLDGFSFTFGDYSNQGNIDILVGHGFGFTNDGIKPDAMHCNQEKVPYVKISLRGIESNRDGIGAIITAYQNNEIQTIQIKAGCSYGTMNSIYPIFNVNENELDSVIVTWPSGTIDKVYNVIENTILLIVEGNCTVPISTISSSEKPSCFGIEKEYAFDTEESIKWMNGDEGNNIYLDSTSAIYARVGENDCSYTTPTIFETFQDTTSQNFTIEVNDDFYPYCQGEISTLIAPEANSYLWENGDVTQWMDVSDEGMYTVIAYYDCHQEEINFSRTNQQINIEWPNSPIETAESENVKITVNGDSILWFENEDDVIPISTGNVYIIDELEDEHKVFVQGMFYGQIKTEIGEQSITEDSDYPFSNLNPKVFFTIYEPIVWSSIDCHSEFDAIREFEIYRNDTLYYSYSFDVGPDDITVPLEVYLEPGEYYITTNESLNIENFGVKSPYLKRTNFMDSNYPYIEDKGIVEIHGNSFYNSTFYFFYNWKFESIPKICTTEKKEVLVKRITSTIDESNGIDVFYNNPILNELNITISQASEIVIYNQVGISVHQEFLSKGTQHIRTSQWSSGMYYIQIDKQLFKIVKL